MRMQFLGDVGVKPQCMSDPLVRMSAVSDRLRLHYCELLMECVMRIFEAVSVDCKLCLHEDYGPGHMQKAQTLLLTATRRAQRTAKRIQSNDASKTCSCSCAAGQLCKRTWTCAYCLTSSTDFFTLMQLTERMLAVGGSRSVVRNGVGHCRLALKHCGLFMRSGRASRWRRQQLKDNGHILSGAA